MSALLNSITPYYYAVMSESYFVASEKLYNFMKVSEKISHNYSESLKMVHDKKISNRSYAIEWMKKVFKFLKLYLQAIIVNLNLFQILSKEICGAVEVSIQIFDRFITISYTEDPAILADTSFLSYSAACSVIMAVKLLDTKTQLSMVSFFNQL